MAGPTAAALILLVLGVLLASATARCFHQEQLPGRRQGRELRGGHEQSEKHRERGQSLPDRPNRHRQAPRTGSPPEAGVDASVAPGSAASAGGWQGAAPPQALPALLDALGLGPGSSGAGVVNIVDGWASEGVQQERQQELQDGAPQKPPGARGPAGWGGRVNGPATCTCTGPADTHMVCESGFTATLNAKLKLACERRCIACVLPLAGGGLWPHAGGLSLGAVR